MTDDQRFALDAFADAARTYHAAEQREQQAFAAFCAAQDAHKEASQALDRARSELAEAQQDLIAELVGAPVGE